MVEGGAGALEVGEFHLGIFAGEDDAVGIAVEGGEDGIADAVGRALAVGGLGGDVDVDAGPEKSVGSGEAGAGTLGFAKNIIRREAGEGNLGERLLLIIEDAVVEVEELLRGDIAIESLGDAADVAGHALAGAVVIHDDFDEVGDGGEGGEVLLRAVDGVEGVGGGDVPADAEGGINLFDVVIDGGVGFAEAVGP